MATLTIPTFQPQITWPHGGATATLRIKYSGDFVDGTGQQVLRGLYKDVVCTIAGGVLTVPQFTLITTNDAQVNPLATCSAQFFDSNGSARDWLFQQFSIPESLTPTATIAALVIYNQGSSLVLPPDFYLNRDETTQLVLALLASIGVLADAAAATKGITKLSIDPTVLSSPIAWGQNDPAARDAQKLMGVVLNALMGTPANTNVPVYDAATLSWKPGIGAQGAAGGGLSGTYPNPAVVDDSHTHGAGTITSLPAHAVDHENGGSDEIDVTDLSGLLADGQTPLTHNTSHESGGSDAIKLDDLAAPDDNTDLDASITAHGLSPKLPNDATQFYNGVGGFSTPAGAGDVVGPAASVDQEIALFDGVTGKLLERATVTGLLKAAAGVLAAAVAGTDYVAPGGALGTPSSGTLTNTTGLPIDSGVSGLAANVATFLGTPSSANLLAALTDETGTGAAVFANAPTLIGPVLGTPASGNLGSCTADGTDEVGFRNIPQNSQSADYTGVITDKGKHIYHPTSDDNPRTWTIPANASVAYPIGTAITFINDQNTITIAITSDTLVWAEDGSTGSRTLAENGMATAIKVTSTRWIISGTGLT